MTKTYGCTVEEWNALTNSGKMLVMSAYICELNEAITEHAAKIKRLTDRGIEDMKHTILELKEVVGILKEHLVIKEARIDNLESIIANVHDELHDPMSQYWCDKPKQDRQLLEALRDRVDVAMGWDKEEGT